MHYHKRIPVMGDNTEQTQNAVRNWEIQGPIINTRELQFTTALPVFEHTHTHTHIHNFFILAITYSLFYNPYPTAFPYGNGMVLHFYQQQESSTTKTVHKVINKGLKTYV